jgi:hypothetical protein
MRSDRSGSVRCLAGCNYGGSGSRVGIIAAIAATQLNRIMAAQAAAQTICTCGCRGQTQEWMQERLCSSKNRFSGCRNDRSESPGLIGGCAA